MSITRRVFLRDGALAVMSVGMLDGFAPGFLRRAALAAEPARSGRQKTLVCLFQRGAVDGLSMVVPFGDPSYPRLRPALAVPKPGSGEGTAVDLDGFFGLHPALTSLKPLFDAGILAAIQACGSPDATRSHFDAQDFMESGAPGDRGMATGWLARALRECPEDRPKRSPLRALALSGSMPRSLLGEPDALAISDLARFGLRERGSMTASDTFSALYEGSSDEALRSTGRDAFEAIRVLRSLETSRDQTPDGVVYPRGGLGDRLRQIARLIKADVGLQVAFTDGGGWDTHAGQGTSTGQLANRLREFGMAIAAFCKDLDDRIDDVVLVTMSEFGRTVRQNGSLGTDHGHATCFFVVGGNVKGGKVYGEWPGLAQENLYEGRDLAMTTDFRDVLGEISLRHMQARRLEPIFPKYRVDPSRFRGLFAS